MEFDISGYIDFANKMMFVKAKLTTNNDAAVGPTNLFLHSLFSQVLNGTLVTASNTYPYRAMMVTLLSYGKDAKRSQLTSSLFYKDEAGRMDSTTFVEATRNYGFYHRREFDMMGRLHADIFLQECYMINEVGVKIKLVRSKDAFCVMGAGKVQILHASLFVRKVKLMSSVFLAHAKTLESGTAKYPIRRVVCKAFTISQGYRHINHEKLFYGQLPTRIIVGLVSNRVFNGIPRTTH